MNWLVATMLRFRVIGWPRPEGRRSRRGASCRPFTLLDGMILIGVAAVGFCGCREGFEGNYVGYALVQVYWSAFLLLASWLVLICRFRRPRPSIRLMTRQPGAVACFAVVATQVVRVVYDLMIERWNMGSFGSLSTIDSASWFFVSAYNNNSASVVPISWALLVAGRRWRPEPGWIDSLGRWIGWAWIVWLIAWPMFWWLEILNRGNDHFLGGMS